MRSWCYDLFCCKNALLCVVLAVRCDADVVGGAVMDWAVFSLTRSSLASTATLALYVCCFLFLSPAVLALVVFMSCAAACLHCSVQVTDLPEDWKRPAETCGAGARVRMRPLLATSGLTLAPAHSDDNAADVDATTDSSNPDVGVAAAV